MERYIIYCTESQTEKAIKLGAPFCNPSDVEGRCPTSEQMIGWLIEQGLSFEIHAKDEYNIFRVEYRHYIKGDFWYYNGLCQESSTSRKECVLSAIDKSLEYLYDTENYIKNNTLCYKEFYDTSEVSRIRVNAYMLGKERQRNNDSQIAAEVLLNAMNDGLFDCGNIERLQEYVTNRIKSV